MRARTIEVDEWHDQETMQWFFDLEPEEHNRILTSISGRQIRDVGDEEGAHAEGEGVVAVRTSRSGRTLRPSRR